MQSRIIIFSTTTTARLRYIAEELLQKEGAPLLSFTDSKEVYTAFDGARINYSAQRVHKSELHLPPATTLLFEEAIQRQEVPVSGTGKATILYPLATGDFPFDVLAAAFYLLSRYEEYLTHTPDRYGRFSHTSSIAHKHGFLQIPLINIWQSQLQSIISQRFPQIVFPSGRFEYLPTYDIDMAYSYRHKGWWRNLGALCKMVLKAKFTDARTAIAVLAGKKSDPFDAFEWLHALHQQLPVRPIYFFLVAAQRGAYDKNIDPKKAVMQNLIRSHGERYTIGIHPSWKSGDDHALLKAEKDILTKYTGPVHNSKQHYLRMQLPATYERLIENNISHDFSMGYGGVNGFRASITTPFRWYHLLQEKVTDLTIHPFCFMDATAYYYQKHSPEQAFEELLYFYDIIQEVKGTMITIWHNDLLGTDPQKAGWRKIYERFLKEIIGVDTIRFPDAVS